MRNKIERLTTLEDLKKDSRFERKVYRNVEIGYCAITKSTSIDDLIKDLILLKEKVDKVEGYSDIHVSIDINLEGEKDFLTVVGDKEEIFKHWEDRLNKQLVEINNAESKQLKLQENVKTAEEKRYEHYLEMKNWVKETGKKL